MNIYYGGQPGDGYGWGVCNRNLFRQLRKINGGKRTFAGQFAGKLDGPLFMPIRDHDLNPVQPFCEGTKTIGYTFFEFELGPEAEKNAQRYDLIFCGSTWCQQKLAERGITNTEVLLQGVDHNVFKPEPHAFNDGKLRVFSGGKFEYRKGQDIVMAAMDLLAKRYDVELTAAWFNPWPATMEGMNQSPYVSSDVLGRLKQIATSRTIQEAPNMRFLTLMPNADLVTYMNQTDIGIFPNRCEGGTNLVLMEYLALGKPAVVSNGTGHLDVIDPNRCVAVNGSEDELGWVHVTPAAVTDGVDKARKLKPEPDRRFTWEAAAQQIYKACQNL